MHTFTKGISATWNANTLIQELNSGQESISYNINSYTTSKK